MLHLSSSRFPVGASLGAVLLLVAGLPARTLAQQSVGIGTTAPDPAAALDIRATDKGLLIPRLDSVQRVAIASPPDGLMVFQTTGRKGFWYALGGAWVRIPDAAQPTPGDNLGNHTATQDLQMGAHSVVVAGEASGVIVDDAVNRRVGLMKYSGRAAGLWRTLGQGFEIGRANVSALPGTPSAFVTDLFVGGNGWVGLGTTSPTARLDVVGETRLRQNVLADGQLSVAGMASFWNGAEVLHNVAVSDGSVLVDGEERGVVVDAGGQRRVGLIKYSGREAGLWRAGNQRFEIGRVNVGSLPGSPSQWVTDLYVAGSGRVGINTDSPNQTFDVNGDADVRGQLGIGYQVVQNDFTLPGYYIGRLTVGCPNGMRAMGGGGGHSDYSWDQIAVRVNYNGPAVSNTQGGWQVNVYNDSATDKQVRVYCLCARVR